MKDLNIWELREKFASKIFFFVLLATMIKTLLPQESFPPMVGFYVTGVLDATLLVLLIINVITLIKKGYSFERLANVIIHLIMFISLSYLFLTNRFM